MQALTYELQNGTWNKQFSLFNPMPRTEASLLLDPVRGNNLLFGGANAAGTKLAETWVYQSGQWSYLSLATAPSARSGHRMAFDRAQGLGLLFGGQGPTGAPLGDFWTWNGTVWSQRNLSTLPPARYAHGLAYDQFRNRTVLYGGQDASGLRDDLWEYDAATWTQITPTPPPAPATGTFGPGARAGFGMTYDPRAERTVIACGESSFGCQSDAWAWDGRGFTQLLPQTQAPSARRGLQLVHDPASNQLLLHAGGCGSTLTNDLFSLDLPVFWRSTRVGTGCQGSNGRTMALAIASGSSAVIGQNLNLTLSDVPFVFFAPYGLIGLSDTNFRGLPLPLDLSVLGLAGCSAYGSGDASVPMSLPNATGGSTWTLPIPNGAYLLGMPLHLQGLSFEAPGFTRWASVSNGVSVRIGSQ
jgi:hypothetical protein